MWQKMLKILDHASHSVVVSSESLLIWEINFFKRISKYFYIKYISLWFVWRVKVMDFFFFFWSDTPQKQCCAILNALCQLACYQNVSLFIMLTWSPYQVVPVKFFSLPCKELYWDHINILWHLKISLTVLGNHLWVLSVCINVDSC